MNASVDRPALLQRLRTLFDGELGQVELAGRERHAQMQEVETRLSLQRMMLLLAGFAIAKCLFASIYHDGAAIAACVGGSALLIGLALAYRRTSGLGQEAAVAVLFLPLLLHLLLGPVEQWTRYPGLAAGGVILLPAIVLPLLVRLRSALAFALVCGGAMLLFDLRTPELARDLKLGLWFHFVLSSTAGFQLRRARAGVGVRYARTLETAWARAAFDPLTGVLNRSGWTRVAERCRAETADRGGVVSLALIDLDHFKRVNDVHGHAAGDEALTRVGRALDARSGESMVVARLGGEEFACLLPDAGVEALERFLARVRADLQAAALPYPLTFSAGIAESRPGESLEALLRRVDRALYAAKDAGRNRTVHAPAPAEPPAPPPGVG